MHVDDTDEAFAAAERKPEWTDLALGHFFTVRVVCPTGYRARL